MQSEDQNNASGTCFLLSTYLASHCAPLMRKRKKTGSHHRKATHTKADPALLTNEKKGRNATQGVPRHPRERSGWTTTRTTAQIRHNLALAETSCLFFLLFSHKTTLLSKKKGPEGQTCLAIYGLHWVILPPLPPSTLQMGFVNKWRRQVFCDLTKKWQILVFFTEYRTKCSWNNFLFCVLHTSEWGGQPT